MNLAFPDLLALPETALAVLAVFGLAALFTATVGVRKAAGPAALAGALAVCALYPASGAAQTALPGGALLSGGFTAFLWLLFPALLGLTALFSFDARRGLPAEGEYYFLMTTSTIGLMTLAAGAELLTVFIGVELLSVSLYALAAINRSAAGAEAGYKYFLLGSFGTGILVLGLALVYGGAGTLRFDALAAGQAGAARSGPAAAGLALLVAGFAFKAALAPFHAWAPDVYEGAPTPVAGFMSGSVKVGGILVLYRLFSLTWGSVRFSGIFWALAALTMVLGTLMALPQKNLKRLLAYSSISQAGYIMTGFFGGKAGLVPVLYYLTVYAFATMGAFAVAAALEKEERGPDLAALAGVAARRPWLAAAMSVFMLSLAGVPPLAGFFGKFYVFSAALGAGSVWLIVIALVMSAVSAYYYLRVLAALYMREERTAAEGAPAGLPFEAALFASALATCALGVFSGPLLKMAAAALP